MAAFQQALGELDAEDIGVVAISVKDEASARETAERTGVTFPMGYGLPLHQTAEKLGAYYEDRREILHATGFLLQPDGVISVAVYSSGPIGRLVAEDVLRLVRFYDKRD